MTCVEIGDGWVDIVGVVESPVILHSSNVCPSWLRARDE